MAGGKTYHGLGEVEAAFRDETLEGEEPRETYSGPTVVDALKVEASLEQLRTMEQPAAGRPTTVGHGSGTPAVRETIGSDPLRGTMFGHSIHLPDVNTPDELTDAPSSGSIELIDPSAPVQLSPFPLADALAPPVEPSRPPPRLDPFRRRGEEAFAFPDEETDQLVPPRRNLLGRAVLVIGGVGAVALLVAFLARGNDADEPWSPPPPPSAATSPAAAPAPPPSPPVEVTPLPTGVEPAAPSPAAAAPPPAAEEPQAVAAPRPEPDREVEVRPARKRRASRRAAISDDEAAAKVARPVKARPALPEDPDATLPLTTLD